MTKAESKPTTVKVENNKNLTNMKKGKSFGCLMVVVFIAGMIFCLATMSSCTTTKVVTVEKVRTDTLVQNHVQRDSIWLHDSVSVMQQGDTIRIDRWHTKYVEKLRHDSIYIAKVDSVPVPYEVVKEVAKPLTLFERVMFCIGLVACMGLILFFAFKIRRFLP